MFNIILTLDVVVNLNGGLTFRLFFLVFFASRIGNTSVEFWTPRVTGL